jgi:hypothetical protein
LTLLDVPQFILEQAMAEKPIFTADEVARWPEGLFSLLEGYELIRPTDNASSVVCDACGHDQVEPVTKLPLPNGAGFRAYIVCPHQGRIRVPLDRLRQWMLDVPKLSAMTGWTPPAPLSDEGAINDPIRLTITEAAKYISVTDRTARDWRANGKLTVIEDDNGQLIFSKSVLGILRQAGQQAASRPTCSAEPSVLLAALRKSSGSNSEKFRKLLYKSFKACDLS